MKSLGRFAQRVKVQEAYKEGHLESLGELSIGPSLVFGRLWEELGTGRVLKGLLRDRSFEFDVERAVYMTVLHRLFESGSDRQGMRWGSGIWLPGAEDLHLHQVYRAMRWLGENKDKVEDGLFCAQRDLFTELSLVFFDTTTLYFEGQGGKTLGQFGQSKDRRSDHRQVAVGALLTNTGRPISCEVSPGDQSDVRALLPLVDSTMERFGLRRVCWVADRGMVSREVIAGLEDRGMEYILGARLRVVREVRNEVLSRPGRYRDVEENLKVKEVWVEDRRYVVCFNPLEAAKEKEDREVMLSALEDKLKQDPKSLVGNRGYRRYLRVEGEAMSVDRKKASSEERFDGKYVLGTNTTLSAEEVAVQYERLWMVERFFRLAKDLLETRPVYHKFDETIRGHIFCSFLALLLCHELMSRLEARGEKPEWSDVIRDLEALREVDVRHDDKRFRLRLPLQGVCGKVFQAAGVA
ncbi:MAG: IS1634 family transposase, partial [Thermodesulfobacteriota bacterium]